MPRRKKNGQSPARVPGGPPEVRSFGQNTGYQQPPAANNFQASTSLSSSAKEEIVRSMQEMFAHLDPEVIFIVLSECDFKVEIAMDSLLELSLAAEDVGPIPSPVSGFERTASALLSPHFFSEPKPDPDPSIPPHLPSSPTSPKILTGELDLLLDQELETLTSQQEIRDVPQSGQYLSSFPPPPFQQQVLPELLQSSLQPASREPSAGVVEHSGASSACDQHSTWKVETEQEVDFTHQMTGTPADMPKPPMDLAASGRPSAFQVYKKQELSHSLSDKAAITPSESIVGATRAKMSMLNQIPIGYVQAPWNLEAPVFSPHVHEDQEPMFITPVAQPPPNWSSQPRRAWSNQGPVGQAPLKPSATIPKSWAMPAPQSHGYYSRLRLQGRVLVLLRGAPGSGKSTLARALVEHNPGAVSLSTDDFFTCTGEYLFDPSALGEAHEWNQKRAKEAFEKGANPIIIDNTNMQGWEMRPYVAQALKHGYKVLFREPDTWWKNKPRELERRSMHKVPIETIRRMLNGYERFVTVQSIMGSRMPESKQHLPLDNNNLQSVSSEAPCPDLVGHPRLTEKFMKPRPQLFSSLPDVSSIGQAAEVETPGDIAHKSTESLNFQPTARFMENPEMSGQDIEMNMEDLDSELDAHLELNHPTEDRRIPDCIVESVMNEDFHGDELPVAFSESIGQRVRRIRLSGRSGSERVQPADLVKDTSLSNTNTEGEQNIKKDEAEGVALANDKAEKEVPRMFDFVGDWPTEGSLEQRPLRKTERHKNGERRENEGVSQDDNENETKVQLEPKVTEFQKLLDLIQTGVADIETSVSPLSSLSPSSDSEEFKKDEEVFVTFERSHSSRANCEEREPNLNMVGSGTGKLPDCVLDWKAADSCKETRTDLLKENKTENKESSIMGGHSDMFETGKETCFSGLELTYPTTPIKADFSGIAGANVQNDERGLYTKHGPDPTKVDTDNCVLNDTETCAEAAGSQISEVGQSPELEGSVEAESGSYSGGSQDRKQRQGRRSGKQCKLALTFTQNCPVPSQNTLECPISSGQSINRQESKNTDAEQNPVPKCDSLSLEPISGPLTEVKSDAQMQPASPPFEADECFSTQTEPQDFALLWRLNHQKNPDVSTYSQPSKIRVLSGNSSCFVPHLSASCSTAVQTSDHREVPNRVAHEKSTQVEENELGATQNRLEHLCILSRHFKQVNYDTLVDLYDKCHQDLDWTTNLLLDSGEMFFKDEDSENKEEDCAISDVDRNTSSPCGDSGNSAETILSPIVMDESHAEHLPSGVKEETPQSSSGTVIESDENSSNANGPSFEASLAPPRHKDHPDTNIDNPLQKDLSCPPAINELEKCGDSEHKVEWENNQEHGAWAGSFDDSFLIEESRFETEEDVASMNEILRVLQEELDKIEGEERQKEEKRPERGLTGERRNQHLDIQSVELKLPTEVALQLTELFGPVGVDPGTCSADDYEVQMDLNLAKLLHQKWKETIEERQRKVTLSYHLLQEGWGDSPVTKAGPRDRTQPPPVLTGAHGYAAGDSQSEASSLMPFMDHWNVSRPQVSLRDIIKEEQALQENMEKTRRNRADLDRRNRATLLKENQLYARFPTIDRHFLQDIFRDHNYNLTQTELFLRSLLGEEPVKTVVAPEPPRSDHHRAASKERETRLKHLELIKPEYQDTEDPEYEDFRAEASLQRRRQLESFSKAAEAFKQGRKEVASFYAQQGHLHGKRMREANRRAAVQIFERVNSSLLPKNILDLHGLHVDEAIAHLANVLEDKTTACEQGLCRPQLSVITGRGNHSQGGVARIRPAVIDYLTNKHYRFTEPKPGLVLVSLK